MREQINKRISRLKEEEKQIKYNKIQISIWAEDLVVVASDEKEKACRNLRSTHEHVYRHDFALFSKTILTISVLIPQLIWVTY